jgi:hypothetical protein
MSCHASRLEHRALAVDRSICFPERQKQEVFAATSKDGFTVVRKTNDDPPRNGK